MNKIYKIPSILFLVLYSIKNIVENSFNSIIKYFIKRKIDEIAQPYYIAHLIDSFNGMRATLFLIFLIFVHFSL